jgi:hypothetical protein
MKRHLAFGSLVAVMVTAIGAEVPVDGPSRLAVLGAGYDALSGEVRGKCLRPGLDEQVEGENAYVHIIQIENEREFAQKLNLGARAKYSLFSAGGSSVSESTFNSYSTYLAVLARIESRTKNLTAPALSPEAKQLATANLQRFREQCGNAFVSSRTLGGEYSALVEIYSSTETQFRETKAKASGAAGLFSASAEASRRLTELLKDRRYEVKLIRKGGTGPIEATKEAILGAALQFPETLKKASDADLVGLRIVAQDYRTIDLPATVAASDLSDTDKLIAVQRRDNELQFRREHLADVVYVIQNPDDFAPVDKQVLLAAERSLRSTLFEANAEVLKCLESSARICQFSVLPSTFRVDLPTRRPGLSREELVAERDALAARIARSQAALTPFYDQRLRTTRMAPGVRQCGFPGPDGSSFGCLVMYSELLKYCQASGCMP